MRRSESQPSPFRSEGLARRASPFLVAMIIAFAALGLPADERDDGMIFTAALLNAGLILSVLVLPWQKLPRVADVLPPLLYLAVVSILRDGVGASDSGYDALYVLPIFWLALHGTRVQLGVGVVGVAVLLGMPVLSIGDPDYPDTEWRRALLGTTVAGIVGLAVQDLVDQIRQRADALHTVSEAVGRRTREVETRWAICEAARQVSGARWVCLLEPDSNERRLVTTAATAPEVEGTEAYLTDADSPVVSTYAANRPHFVDVTGKDIFTSATGVSNPVSSALFHPVPGRDGAVAVIVAAWETPVKRLPETLPSVMEALSAEAAGVIERTTLVLRLEGTAKVDELSGLPNERAFQEELPREVSRARRSNRALSVALIDIGDFDPVDADGGLSSGDRRVLQGVGKKLKRLVSQGDFLAALQPGRFGVIFQGVDADAARAAAERLSGVAPSDRECRIAVSTWDGFELPAALVARAESEIQAERAAAAPARD